MVNLDDNWGPLWLENPNDDWSMLNGLSEMIHGTDHSNRTWCPRFVVSSSSDTATGRRPTTTTHVAVVNSTWSKQTWRAGSRLWTINFLAILTNNNSCNTMVNDCTLGVWDYCTTTNHIRRVKGLTSSPDAHCSNSNETSFVFVCYKGQRTIKPDLFILSLSIVTIIGHLNSQPCKIESSTHASIID